MPALVIIAMVGIKRWPEHFSWLRAFRASDQVTLLRGFNGVACWLLILGIGRLIAILVSAHPLYDDMLILSLWSGVVILVTVRVWRQLSPEVAKGDSAVKRKWLWMFVLVLALLAGLCDARYLMPRWHEKLVVWITNRVANPYYHYFGAQMDKTDLRELHVALYRVISPAMSVLLVFIIGSIFVVLVGGPRRKEEEAEEGSA
jgi:hypothetical protein